MGQPSALPPRRLTPKGRQTRNRIVEAAAELMARRGVAGTSIDVVRQVASVSGSQMAHYFPTKQSLVRAVIAWQTERILEPLRQLPQGFTTLAELESWVRSTLERCRSETAGNGSLLGGLAGELAETDRDVRADLADGFGQWLDCLQNGFRTMQERGELHKNARPRELAITLLSALQGGMLLTRTSRDFSLLETSLSVVLEHIRSSTTSAY